jgi:hypothetical protein
LPAPELLRISTLTHQPAGLEVGQNPLQQVLAPPERLRFSSFSRSHRLDRVRGLRNSHRLRVELLNGYQQLRQVRLDRLGRLLENPRYILT